MKRPWLSILTVVLIIAIVPALGCGLMQGIIATATPTSTNTPSPTTTYTSTPTTTHTHTPEPTATNTATLAPTDTKIPTPTVPAILPTVSPTKDLSTPKPEMSHVKFVNNLTTHLHISLNGPTVRSLSIAASAEHTFDIVSGEYRYEVTASGYLPAEGTITFPPGDFTWTWGKK